MQQIELKRRYSIVHIRTELKQTVMKEDPEHQETARKETLRTGTAKQR